MDTKKIFEVDKIGKLKFLATLVEVDYPRTFLCKKVGNDDKGNIELYIFDEYDHNNESITWICTRVTFEEVDDLNSGWRTLESCFFGPRSEPRSGFKVTSRKGKSVAECEYVSNVSRLIDEYNTYIDPIIYDDESHGSNLASLIYEEPLMSLIINEDRYADPMIEREEIKEYFNSGDNMFKHLPFNVQTTNNRVLFTNGHSVVLHFEVNDKKNGKSKNEQFEELQTIETIKAFNAIGAMLDPSAQIEDISKIVNNDTNAIEKTNVFIDCINKKTTKSATIVFNDFSKGLDSSSFSKIVKLDKDNTEIVRERNTKAIEHINNSIKPIESINEYYGTFSMYDSEKSKFIFNTLINNTSVKIIGTSQINKAVLVDKNNIKNKKYKAKIKQITPKKPSDELGKSEYILLDIEEYNVKVETVDLLK